MCHRESRARRGSERCSPPRGSPGVCPRTRGSIPLAQLTRPRRVAQAVAGDADHDKSPSMDLSRSRTRGSLPEDSAERDPGPVGDRGIPVPGDHEGCAREVLREGGTPLRKVDAGVITALLALIVAVVGGTTYILELRSDLDRLKIGLVGSGR